MGRRGRESGEEPPGDLICPRTRDEHAFRADRFIKLWNIDRAKRRKW